MEQILIPVILDDFIMIDKKNIVILLYNSLTLAQLRVEV